MGHKNVCFTCRKSYNLGSDVENFRKSTCPECGKGMILLPHRFRPPKKKDEKKWETAKFLVENGFHYHNIFDDEIARSYVPYPENLKDAKIFVEKYKAQRIITE